MSSALEQEGKTSSLETAVLGGGCFWDKPIVTELSQLELFYPAEDYHQEYYKYNSQQPYCQAVIAPKLSKFRQQFLTSLKKN